MCFICISIFEESFDVEICTEGKSKYILNADRNNMPRVYFQYTFQQFWDMGS